MAIKEKNLRVIMELIFIFILPLMFLLPTLNIDNEYVYDSNGNFESSQKKVSFTTPFTYIKEDNYINYIDFNQLIETDLFNGTQDINGITFTFNNGALNIDGTATDYADFIFGYIDGNNDYYLGISGNPSIEVRFSGFNGNYDYVIDRVGATQMYIRVYPNQVVENVTIYPMVINLSQAFGDNYIPTYSEFKSYFPNEYYSFTLSDIIEIKSDNIISSNYAVNYTIWGRLHSLFIDYLDVGNSVLLDLFMAYTILWILMFIVWHLWYRLLDFIVHCYDRVSRRE